MVVIWLKIDTQFCKIAKGANVMGQKAQEKWS